MPTTDHDDWQSRLSAPYLAAWAPVPASTITLITLGCITKAVCWTVSPTDSAPLPLHITCARQTLVCGMLSGCSRVNKLTPAQAELTKHQSTKRQVSFQLSIDTFRETRKITSRTKRQFKFFLLQRGRWKCPLGTCKPKSVWDIYPQ